MSPFTTIKKIVTPIKPKQQNLILELRLQLQIKVHKILRYYQQKKYLNNKLEYETTS